MGLFSNPKVDRLIEQLEEISAQLGRVRDPNSVAKLLEEKTKLRHEVDSLKTEKSQLEESTARKIRETEHKVGLLKQQVEVEAEQNRKQVELDLREGNLEQREELFDKQMAFFKEHTAKMEELQERFTNEVLKRLPDLTATLEIAAGGSNTREPTKTATTRRKAN